MTMDLEDEFRELQPKRVRTRFVGSAGGIAFLSGAAVAGKCMMWIGMFKPGLTPNSEILNYWPGFLLGGAVLGFPAAYAARLFYDFYLSNE
jgi:hypothetical protein